MKPLALSSLFLLLASLLSGCGYERHPVRVRWHLQTTPPSAVAPGDILAYGLDVAPPWRDPGHLVLSIPETISADSGATTLFSSTDLVFTLACPKCVKPTLFTAPAGSKIVHCSVCGEELHVLPTYIRRDVWNIANDERTATLDLDSPSTPGVHLRIDLKVAGPRMHFNLTLANNTRDDLHHLSARFASNLAQLNSFSDSGRSLPPVPPDRSLVLFTETSGNRKFLITWLPGDPVAIDPAYSSTFVNPRLGDLPAGKSVHAAGLILFSQGSTDQLLKEALKPAK